MLLFNLDVVSASTISAKQQHLFNQPTDIFREIADSMSIEELSNLAITSKDGQKKVKEYFDYRVEKLSGEKCPNPSQISSEGLEFLPGKNTPNDLRLITNGILGSEIVKINNREWYLTKAKFFYQDEDVDIKAGFKNPQEVKLSAVNYKPVHHAIMRNFWDPIGRVTHYRKGDLVAHGVNCSYFKQDNKPLINLLRVEESVE